MIPLYCTEIIFFLVYKFVAPHLMKKKVSTEKVALLMVWNMKFLSVTVLSVLFSATRGKA